MTPPPHIGLQDADIGIITALPKELAAALVIFECGATPVPSPRREMGISYWMSTLPALGGGEHVVAISSLINMGNNFAAIVTGQMLNDCPKIKHVIMVGIAGAIPNPISVEHHVRLGDIVVSNMSGVIQFDLGKDDEIKGFEFRSTSHRPSAALLSAVNVLQTHAEMNVFPWRDHIGRAIAGQPQWKRPDDSSDILIDYAEPILHPLDGNRPSGNPKVFLGTIGSSNILLKNAHYRDQLRDQHRIKAVEMESAGVVDATWLGSCGYLVVRGTCDYCNEKKNDIWQAYAAVIAASYSRAVIEHTPAVFEVTPSLNLDLPSGSQGQLARFEKQITRLENLLHTSRSNSTANSPEESTASETHISDQELYDEKARDFISRIDDALQWTDLDRAWTILQDAEKWLLGRTSRVNADIVSELYATMANTATAWARKQAFLGKELDLKYAESLLEKARGLYGK